MKFKIEISRTDYGFVEVEAPNESEAKDLAIDKEQEGNITWTNSDVEVCNSQKYCPHCKALNYCFNTNCHKCDCSLLDSIY